ncbi:MAG: DoxX family protein [Ilumatobacteraceae bacterium]
MFFACVVVTLLLAFVTFGSAMGALKEDGPVRQLIDHVGLGRWLRVLGFVELTASVGLVVGLFWAPIGVAAAAGLVVFFLGAMIAHIRVGDPPGPIMAPAVPMLLSIAALVLRLATM